jgi:hypothetical protein
MTIRLNNGAEFECNTCFVANGGMTLRFDGQLDIRNLVSVFTEDACSKIVRTLRDVETEYDGYTDLIEARKDWNLEETVVYLKKE